MTRTQVKILYVGRRATVRRRLSAVLENAGYVVTTDVSSVAKLLSTQRRRYELLAYEARSTQGLARLFTQGRRSAASAPLAAAASPGTRNRSSSGKPNSLRPITLRALRELVGKTQSEVARKTAMSQSQLSRVEARRDHLVSTLRKYARALGGDIQIVVLVKDLGIILRDV